MVPSHRRVGSADAAALFPGDGIFGRTLLATFVAEESVWVTAGVNPAYRRRVRRELGFGSNVSLDRFVHGFRDPGCIQSVLHEDVRGLAVREELVG